MEPEDTFSEEQSADEVTPQAARPAAATATKAVALNKLTQTDLESIISDTISKKLDQMAKAGAFTQVGKGSAHANSGPTTHSNVPGHANFTKVGTNAGGIFAGGAHANAGPTTHSNVPGHANFGKAANPGDIFAAGSHVNSGPTGHSNVPGHANFTKVDPNQSRIFPAVAVTLPSGLHVNIPASADQVVTINGFRITRG